LEIVKTLLSDGFFSDNLKKIQKNTDLSYYEIDNKLSFIKNLILKEVNHIDLNKFYGDVNEKYKFQKMLAKLITDKKFLGDKLKSFNRSVGRALNKRYRELKSGNYSSSSNYDATILKILNLASIADVSSVYEHDWVKGKQRYRKELKNNLLSMNISINCWSGIIDERMILRNLIKGDNRSSWVNGASLQDLLEFIKNEFDDLLKKQMIRYFKIHFLKEINSFLNILLTDLGTGVPRYLKIPEFNSLSIPLGIDDGQVYRLEEQYTGDDLNSVELRISLRAKISHNVCLDDIDRYNKMIKLGFSAHRGVLSFSHGKYFVYIPFKKKVSEERDGDLIASADLGLKTLATLSIFDKNIEIDRKFLDQSNLGGKKEDWFVSGKMVNLKSKLMEHRFVARRQQSVRMSSKNATIKHWYAKNIEKTKWRKIANLHDELIHQIATRIIAYLNHYHVSTLVLEDLKWSKHSSKNQVGYFLSTWQVHWFFSQIQELLGNMALLNGIHVELVNPRNSSKICWKCGEFGVRSGKSFICSSNRCIRYQVDSDLNASRNLITRSKRYKRLIHEAIC
ncbi:MAG: zinc ribbon domain-containing protein, partial [Candidatus Heimdallarchaeota archaeon]